VCLNETELRVDAANALGCNPLGHQRFKALAESARLRRLKNALVAKAESTVSAACASAKVANVFRLR